MKKSVRIPGIALRSIAAAAAAAVLACLSPLTSRAAGDIAYVRLTLDHTPAVGRADPGSVRVTTYQREYSLAAEVAAGAEGYAPGDVLTVDVALTAAEGHSFTDIKKASCKMNDTTAVTMSVMDGGGGLLLRFEMPPLGVVLDEPRNLRLTRGGTACWDPVEGADSYSVTVQSINDMGSRSYVGTVDTRTVLTDLSGTMYGAPGDYVFTVRACSSKKWLLDSAEAALPVSESVLITADDIGYTERDLDREGRIRPAGSASWLRGRTVRLMGRDYRLGDDGLRVSGWVTDDGRRYYFDPVTYVMARGPFTDGGREYYADPSDGHVLTGFVETGGGERYYAADGHAETGWVRHGGNVYYICPDGRRNREQLMDGNGRTYMFSRDDGRLLSIK